ncbi:MAG: short-chain dehydrogenase [Myxococcales bacterium]|nr:short-chain dehydrogenase [Myxococcales bacterium]
MGWSLVTGAGIRIGRAVAEALAAKGDKVILHANRSLEKAEDCAKAIAEQGGTACVVQADLSEPSGPAKLVEGVLGVTDVLDTLVNNAAIYEKVAFENITQPQISEMLRINLLSPFLLIQNCLPLFDRASAPSVVNIIDTNVHRPEIGYAHYAMSKAGLWGLTKALSSELGARLRVNGVGPGAIAFPERFSEAERASVLARVPMDRVGSVDDIAAAVVFLAKDAPYISGEMIHVDGGWNANS